MELIQEIGSYAGFAAVIGLAVLSALYFSQARDVRRLRDWAGRAPERDAEARSRVAAAGQARVPTPAVTQPAAANSGNNVGAATPAGTAAKAGAKPAAAGAAAAAGGAGRGGVSAPPRPATSRVSAQHTQVLGAGSNGGGPSEARWYRRMPARYIALIVAGVLVVGGGIAFGVTQILSSDDSGAPTASGGGGGGSGGDAEEPKKPSAPKVQPGDVSVAVFNGTLTPGLGKETGDKIERLGFQKASVGNAPENGQKAESVVFYAPGKKREAQLVRRRLKISNIEPLDDIFSPLAGTADVVIVVGADATQ